MADLEAAKRTLLGELREHSLVLGEVTLSSGAKAAVLRRRAARAAAPGGLSRRRRADRGRRDRGGGRPRSAARPPRRSRSPARRSRCPRARAGRLLRPRRRKEHGLQRWVEGPVEAGDSLPRRRGHRDHRRLDRRRDRAGSARRASRWPPSSPSSTGSPEVARGSKRRPRRPSGPWSRSTRSTRSGLTVTDPQGLEPEAAAGPRPGRPSPRAAPTRSRSGSSAAWSRSSARLLTSIRSPSTRCGSPATSRRTATRWSTTTRQQWSEALRRLALRGWTRLASGAGSRARKYRHLLDRRSGSAPRSSRCSRVLMLRGAQTPGELKQRSERLHLLRRPCRGPASLDSLVGARLRRPPPAPARPEGGALRAAGRGRERRPRGDPRRSSRGRRRDRLERLEARRGGAESSGRGASRGPW